MLARRTACFLRRRCDDSLHKFSQTPSRGNIDKSVTSITVKVSASLKCKGNHSSAEQPLRVAQYEEQKVGGLVQMHICLHLREDLKFYLLAHILYLCARRPRGLWHSLASEEKHGSWHGCEASASRTIVLHAPVAKMYVSSELLAILA